MNLYWYFRIQEFHDKLIQITGVVETGIFGDKFIEKVSYIIGYEENVEFIELTNTDRFEALYNGVDLHKLKATEALEIVLSDDNYDPSDPELGYSYIFKKLQLSLWRSVISENESDSEGQYFEAVGIGGRDYF